MMRAGEVSGTLDEVLERLASTLESEHALRKRAGTALIYPGFVTAAALALVVFLIVAIVPAFESMYRQMHVPLPPLTAGLIAVGTLLRSPTLVAILILAALAAFLGFAALRPKASGSSFFQALAYRLPILGIALKKAALARVARILGSLMRSGVGVLESLQLAASASTGELYRASLDDVRRGLAHGVGLCAGLEQTGLYDPLFLQLIRAGEETGALDAMLLQLADYYEADVQARLSSLSAVVEPLLILFLGGIVGVIVSAIFIPLYSLIGSIR